MNSGRVRGDRAGHASRIAQMRLVAFIATVTLFCAGVSAQEVDTDGDGLSDAEELEIGTDPLNPDTDGGGVGDGAELAQGTDPLNPADDNLVDAFVRCDPNNDGRLQISDAIWILNDLCQAGAHTRCRAAADCNDDGNKDISDSVYALSYLFLGGPRPRAPFPDCGRIDAPVEDCPPGSTICP